MRDHDDEHAQCLLNYLFFVVYSNNLCEKKNGLPNFLSKVKMRLAA